MMPHEPRHKPSRERVGAARNDRRFTHVLVGGGLHNGLLALALRRFQPSARVALVEAAESLGGNHTWCLHAGDAAGPGRAVIAPLLRASAWPSWDGYDVRFPGWSRTVASPYAGFTSQALDQVVREAFDGWAGSTLMLGAAAVEVAPGEVTLGDGRVVTGDVVFDARGPGSPAADSQREGEPGEGLARGHAARGFQKFYGLELELARPHNLPRPVLMDATVPQLGGFRFFYTLPLGPRRVLLEDTRFALSPSLEPAALRAEVLAEVGRRGWTIAREVRSEQGVLAMPWAGEVTRPTPRLVRGGYGGGWFHPATGYSLPIALRAAVAVAQGPPEAAHERLLAVHRDTQRQRPFLHTLNQLLFQCFEPEDMWNSFVRFYRKGTPALFERFYAMRLSPTDKTRLLLGRPPRRVKLARAMAVLA